LLWAGPQCSILWYAEGRHSADIACTPTGNADESGRVTTNTLLFDYVRLLADAMITGGSWAYSVGNIFVLTKNQALADNALSGAHQWL
jgi:hypothetical protein